MTTRFWWAGAACFTLCIGLAVDLHAQGNLSTQGFGYPPGQLSSRAEAMGGGVGEVDPQSQLNPATLVLWGAPVLFGQYGPEFRRVNTPSGSTRTTTARFPLVGFSLPLGRRWAAGGGVSTFLDRTWATAVERTQVIGPDTVTSIQRFTSDGAINDVRLAVAYAATPRLSIGVAAHVYTGEHRITTTQEFPDTVRFLPISERSDISYGGTAFSAGVETRVARHWQLGASFRRGGDITSKSGDTTLSSARIPTRYGVSVAYGGISGATVAARIAHDKWSSLGPLGSANVTAFDGWDVGVGADVGGPRIGRRPLTLRVGGRQRTLPFGADGAEVKELSLSTGIGIPVAIDRAHVDITLLRAARDAERAPSGTFGPGGERGNVDETAYILSIGIRVRP
jgi:hypothetical protein